MRCNHDVTTPIGGTNKTRSTPVTTRTFLHLLRRCYVLYKKRPPLLCTQPSVTKRKTQTLSAGTMPVGRPRPAMGDRAGVGWGRGRARCKAHGSAGSVTERRCHPRRAPRAPPTTSTTCASRFWRNVFGRDRFPRNRGERALDLLRTTRSLPLCSVRPRRRPRAPRRAPPCPSPPLLTLTLSHTIYACMGPAQAVRGCRRRGRVWTGGGNRGTLDSPENP
jgi:hypothetical protein